MVDQRTLLAGFVELVVKAARENNRRASADDN
jgi:hypothetical protein